MTSCSADCRAALSSARAIGVVVWFDGRLGCLRVPEVAVYGAGGWPYEPFEQAGQVAVGCSSGGGWGVGWGCWFGVGGSGAGASSEFAGPTGAGVASFGAVDGVAGRAGG